MGGWSYAFNERVTPMYGNDAPLPPSHFDKLLNALPQLLYHPVSIVSPSTVSSTGDFVMPEFSNNDVVPDVMNVMMQRS